MALSRHEINLRRLLAKCELMCKGKQKADEKIPQYIATLDNMYHEFKESNPTNESLLGYERRILALKVLLGMDILPLGPESENLSHREELLGFRQRQVKQERTRDVDELITLQQEMQDKIAKEMLILTSNLKENSQLASKIIKKDTEVIGNSTQLSEKNFSKLKGESNKLAEHTKRACKCWLWVMLAIVVVVFINMVLFMKVAKKSK